MWAMVMVAAMAQIDFPAMPGYRPTVKPLAARRVYGPELAPPVLNYERVPDSTDAVAWAIADLAQRKAAGQTDFRYLRYLWVPPWGKPAWHDVNSLAVNSTLNQSSLVVLPEGTAGGWLIVWKLDQLAPRIEDLNRLLVAWDALAIKEPYFHVALPDGFLIATNPYKHTDGKTYTKSAFAIAPHVHDGYALLSRELHTAAPLLRADDFLRRISSSVESDGGLYYHFAGFIRDGKRLSEAEIFKLVGLDVGTSRRVEGDDRAAIFHSGVTAKPRMVEAIQGAVGRGRITYDLFDEDDDADRHPIYELLNFVEGKARGKEIIFDRPNGLHGFILTDGAGKLVDVAPPNLASDHRVPSPATTQLFPPLSCIRCHGPDDGVKRVRNDVPPLLAGGQQDDVDYFGEIFGRKSREEDVIRVAGLFAAADKFNGDLADSRFRLADAVWSATRGMDVKDKERVVAKAYGAWAEQYAAYWYPRSESEANVTPDQAALEFGFKCLPGEGAKVLSEVMPANRVDLVIDGKPIEFADPSLAALKRGLSIGRKDFQRVYSFGASMVLKNKGAAK